MTAGAHVHYGCGLYAPDEWLNFDASPTLQLERVPVVGRWVLRNGPHFPANVRFGDIVKGLPIPAQSAAAVYCSHVLEHLSLNDFRAALANTRKVLRSGGVFRLVVPDLRVAAQRYVSDPGESAAVRFMSETSLGTLDRGRGLSGLLRNWLGNSRHLWMWDYASLRVELEKCGFTGVRAATLGDATDPLFAKVEEPSRWDEAVAIHCHA